MAYFANMRGETVQKRQKTDSKVVNYSNPFAVPNLLEELGSGKFGSVTKEIESLISRKMQILNPYFSMYPTVLYKGLNVEKKQIQEDPTTQGNEMMTLKKFGRR